MNCQLTPPIQGTAGPGTTLHTYSCKEKHRMYRAGAWGSLWGVGRLSVTCFVQEHYLYQFCGWHVEIITSADGVVAMDIAHVTQLFPRHADLGIALQGCEYMVI